jgi:uncharacterized membrane protein (Fun14 family)
LAKNPASEFGIRDTMLRLCTLITLALTASTDAAVIQRQRRALLSLRGGRSAAAPDPMFNKVVPEWSGTTVDLALGSVVGGTCGYLVGSVLATATKTTVSLTKFCVSQTAFAFAASRIAANLGLVTVHWDRIGLLGWRLFRFVDADGDGKLTKADLNASLARILPASMRAKIFEALDVDNDGVLTSKDAAILSKSNQHSAAGGVVGFVVGFAKGLGVA